MTEEEQFIPTQEWLDHVCKVACEKGNARQDRDVTWAVMVIGALVDEVERLRRSVWDYGDHTSRCPRRRNIGTCDCGFAEFIPEVERLESERRRALISEMAREADAVGDYEA